MKKIGKLFEMDVYQVDGTKIRNEIFIDFTMGGNPEKDDFIPVGQLWLDKNLNCLDSTATLLHEYVECRFLKDRGWNYQMAHDEASRWELVFIQKYRRLDYVGTYIDLVQVHLRGAWFVSYWPNILEDLGWAKGKADFSR